MKLKFGSLLLFAASVATMSAQTPNVTADIYSQIGGEQLSIGPSVFYSFGSWYTTGSGDAMSPLFEQMVSENVTSIVDGVISEADGISISWNNVDKQVTVNCPSEKLGHTSVLIAAMDGATRGMVGIDATPAVISLSDYAPGIYAVAVAVDGKLIKTFKITLK